MHRPISLLGFVILAAYACAGTGKPDPLAGWGGNWVGEYASSFGNSGAIELGFSVDSAGATVGVIRFDAGMGMQSAPLESLVLTADSVTATLRFDGMVAEVAGVRRQDTAEGTYTVVPEGAMEIADSGTWNTTRTPAESRRRY